MGKRCVIACIGLLVCLVVLLSVSHAPMLGSAEGQLARPDGGTQVAEPYARDPTTTCLPDADADVCDSAPTQNRGTSPYMYAGHDIDTGRLQAYVHFDLSVIPDGATIIAAAFHAYLDMVSGYPHVVVHQVLEPWSELDVTWEARPMIGHDVFSTDLTYEDADTWIHWDMTGIIGEWLEGSPNHGLCLVGWGQPNGDLTMGDYARFHTREAANWPYLSVTYTAPEVTVTPTADETPPTVTVTHWPDPVSASDEVTFHATVAADPSGIDGVEIHVIDLGEQLCPCPSSPCSCDGGPYPEGTVVTYYAVAWDGVGNEGRTDDHQFTVGAERDNTPPDVYINHTPDEPTIFGEVLFTANAFDESGIERIDIYVNDSKVFEWDESPCGCIGGPYTGIVTYAAYAQDTAGNGQMSALESFMVSFDLCDAPVLPSSFDWREWGFVTPIRNQGMCGSCWAHSAVGAVEGKYSMEQEKPDVEINLSEQQFVSDCLPGHCCNGGWPAAALRQMVDRGVVDEDCFPYRSDDCMYWDAATQEVLCCDAAAAVVQGCTVCTCEDGSCSNPCLCALCTGASDRYWKIGTYQEVPAGENALKAALICHGHLSVVSRNWGHAVVLIGYDDDSAICRNAYGQDGCWIVKNSWGVFTGWWVASDGTLVWHSDGYAFIPYDFHNYSDLSNISWYVEGVIAP